MKRRAVADDRAGQAARRFPQVMHRLWATVAGVVWMGHPLTMKFPHHILDEIRARLPISQVVGRHVQWDRRRSRPSRGDWWACCPFHHEKTPSFHADDRRGHYYCFGCHAKGDIFTFLVEKEGLSFPEAVERLAAEAGVHLPKPSPEEEKKAERRASLHDVLESAACFYETCFWSAEGIGARRYAMEMRGLDEPTLRHFRIGMAPDARDALLKHMTTAGHDIDLLVEAGLVVVPEEGGGQPYDRFRNRLMFPIRDARGRVIAFGGRALGETRAKYLNSPEGPLFHKSRMLYNLDLARGPALERSEVIVVEGYMDVIALHRSGFPHVVAPLGTALTEEQLMLLWRLCPAPVLCLDGDVAGRKAAWRAVENALPRLRPGHSLKVAYLPEGRDPDDLLREEGPTALRKVLEGALPLVDVIWREVIENSPMRTPEERAAVERRFEDLAGRIQESSVRSHYRSEFRERLARLWGRGIRHGKPGRDKGRLARRSGRWTQRNNDAWPARTGGARGGVSASVVSSRLKALSSLTGEAYHERQILKIILLQPEILEGVFEELAELPFTSAPLDSLRRKILDIAAAHPALDSTRLLAHLEEAGCGAEVQQLIGRRARAGRHVEAPVLDLTHATVSFAEHAAAIRRTALLKKELEAAERAFGKDPSEENLARINRIREELQAARTLPGASKP